MSGQHPVLAAVEFLADCGNAERFLAVHRPDVLGRCIACSVSHRVAFPCTVARWAQEAVAQRARTTERLATAGEAS